MCPFIWLTKFISASAAPIVTSTFLVFLRPSSSPATFLPLFVYHHQNHFDHYQLSSGNFYLKNTARDKFTPSYSIPHTSCLHLFFFNPIPRDYLWFYSPYTSRGEARDCYHGPIHQKPDTDSCILHSKVFLMRLLLVSLSFTPREFFLSALADGFSLEFERQQAS